MPASLACSASRKPATAGGHWLSASPGSGCWGGRSWRQNAAPPPAPGARRFRARVGASAVAVSAMRGTSGSAGAAPSVRDIRDGNRAPIATRNAPRRWRTAPYHCSACRRSSSSRKPSLHQPFRRDIQQLQFAAKQAAVHFACRRHPGWN